MKHRRLPWLMAVLGVLAILRVLVPPPGRGVVPLVAEAIVRKALPAAKRVAPSLPTSVPVETAPPQRDEFDDPGNAFAVRPPPPRPDVPPVVVAKVKAAPPAPAPILAVVAAEPGPLPMPYQVIGTWDDGKESGVFLSSPNGTLFARPGMTLQAEYKVTAITPKQISLLHLATQREVSLAVPRPPNTPLAYP